MENTKGVEIFGKDFIDKELVEFKTFKESAFNSKEIIVEDTNVMRKLFNWHFHSHYLYAVFTTDKAVLESFVDLFPKQEEKTWMPAKIYPGTFSGKFMLHPNRIQQFFMVAEDYHALVVYRMFWNRYEAFSRKIDESVRDED